MQHSAMKAITQPGRWGYTVVDVFFGAVRPKQSQDVACAGDILADHEGKLWEFRGRVDNRLDLTPVDPG